MKPEINSQPCTRCSAPRENHVAVEYPYGHPDRYDGVSEYECLRCGLRRGRWTGDILATDASRGIHMTEPRFGGEQ